MAFGEWEQRRKGSRFLVWVTLYLMQGPLKNKNTISGCFLLCLKPVELLPPSL